ncbi:MAG: ABC-type dipeptide/oligopeptide/nickel transport system permease component [Acidimicrobiaceae bacterium]|nr:MAG: ABC-type dipeptide/oligopeptide/nickel transport system permease component [Acidimicrobiaceae bacterium]
MTAPDGYTAQHADEDEALHQEEALQGRPYELAVVQHGGLFRDLISDKLGIASFIFLVTLIAAAALAPWIAPESPTQGNLSNAFASPVWHGGTWRNPVGTDWQGYDLLSRLLYGARTSLIIGVLVVVLAGTFGVLIGLLAGYKGGRADRWLMGWVDVQISFPGLLLAMLLIALVGGSVLSVTIILAINGWMVYARMTRGVVLSVRERPFVEAAEMMGCRPRRVVFHHILPNLSTPLVTLAVLEFARIILAEAALSFLGLGIQYPTVSWGLDIARAGDHELFGNQWLIIYPGLLLSLTVLSVNLLSSWLRVAADPQEREKRFASRASGTVSGAAGGGGAGL